MAVITLIRSVHLIDSTSSKQTPAELRQELEIGQDNVGSVEMDSGEEADQAAVVQMLVDEFKNREALQQKLNDAEAQKQALQVCLALLFTVYCDVVSMQSDRELESVLAPGPVLGVL